MTTKILPYKSGSASARDLSEALGVQRLRLRNSQWRPRITDTIINWGNDGGFEPRLLAARWLNPYDAVLRARNKLATFRILERTNVPTVRWTTDKEQAQGWLANSPVYVRHSLTGQGGSGIEYVAAGDTLPNAPLYTERCPARHEYRVHVIGEETHVSKKRRREGAERNPVRNHANGYVYCTSNITWPPAIEDTAKAAVAYLGLHFGAVDMLVNERGEAFVLEVNTAPGLEGVTLDWYARTLVKEYL